MNITRSTLMLCDVHIGRDGAREEDTARALIERLPHRYDPDSTMLAWLGDMTDDGSREQIGVMGSIMDRASELGFCQVATPGNHDVARDGWQGASEHLHARFISRIVLRGDLDVTDMVAPWYTTWGAWRIVIADTMQALVGVDLRPDLARGEIGAEQMRAIERLLIEHDGPTMLFGHHHWTYRTHYLTGDNALADVEAARRMIMRARPDVVGMGHKHRYELLEIDGARVAVAGARCTELQNGWAPVVEIQTRGEALLRASQSLV